MGIRNATMAAVFPVPGFETKPRSLRQTWLKDVGFDEAPYYAERMGLVELKDFLDVTQERLDYVKITTPQVLYSPEGWLSNKIETYRSHGIEPYLDHTYFKLAYSRGAVERAIEAGAKLGFQAIEFMNTWQDITPEQWRIWRGIATNNGMQIIYEHHPIRNWDRKSPNIPSTADDIVRNALPFLEDGAFTLLMDHEEFELQGERAADVYGKVIDKFGLKRMVFEVTSPKESPTQWRTDLESYFELFGSDANVSNIMPSQALFVEGLRARDVATSVSTLMAPFHSNRS